MRTPSGAIAEVLALYHEQAEALVRWPNGETARFRVHHLRGLPGGES